MTNPKIRLQFDFSPKMVERIDKIMKKLEANSRAEVIRRAIKLLEYTIDCNKNGDRVIIKNISGEEQIIYFE